MKILLGVVALFVLAGYPLSRAYAQTPNQKWHANSKAIWPMFQKRPDLIDLCARPIATGAAFSGAAEWPWYCNTFKTTKVVRNRAAEMERELAAIKDTSIKSRILAGRIWVGATAEDMELSWGRPSLKKARGKSIIWMYQGCGCYVLFRDGHVSEYQFYR